MLYLMVTLPDVLLILGFHSWCASVTCLIAFDGKRQNIGWSSLRLATWRMNRKLENAPADAATEWGQPTIEKHSKYKGRLANRPRRKSSAWEVFVPTSIPRNIHLAKVRWLHVYSASFGVSGRQYDWIESNLRSHPIEWAEGHTFESRINWKRMVAMKSNQTYAI